MAALLDDLATWSYLALTATVIAVLALGSVLVLALRVSARGRDAGRAGEQDPAPQHAAAGSRQGGARGTGSAGGRRVTSAPHGEAAPAEDERDPAANGPALSWPSLGAAAPAPGVSASAGVAADEVVDPAARLRADHGVAAVAALREVSLLGRQLELLDGLERRAEDPEELAVLFALDNLTMRLRRNAESVLVLTGKEPRRRARDPLPVSDTVRTACSQVEDYERVTVAVGYDPVVQASRVVPLAHLLAELIENATRFSAPDTQVQVGADRDGDGVAVTISDAGIGMDRAALDDARARLDGRTAPESGGRIGLVVAGRIARRFAVAVDLESGPGGTTATVRIPARVLSGSPSRPAPPVGSGAPLAVPPPSASSTPSTVGASDLASGAAPSRAPGTSTDVAAPELSDPSGVLPPRGRPGAPSGAAPGRPPVPGPGGLGTTAPAASAPAPGWPSVAGTTLPPVLPDLDPGLLGGSEFVPQSPGPEVGALPRRGPAAPAAPVVTPGAAAPADGWFQPSSTSAAASRNGSTLRDEAFAEIGRLSGYHPTRTATAEAPPLERRTPQEVEEPVSTNRGPASRDASAVKSRFAAFQSGRGRARRR